MGFLVLASPNSYQTEIASFFDNLRLASTGASGGVSLQQPTAPHSRIESGAGGPLSNYVFQVPPTWTQTPSRDRIVLVSPVYQTGEKCQITLDPMRPATQPLPNEVIRFYREIFRVEPLAPYAYVQPKLARGISPQGWEYFMIRKSIGGTDGDMGTFVFMAQVGNQIATIVGVGKRPLVSSCLGEIGYNAWPGFFGGLQFRNAMPSGQEQAAIRQRLAGTWIAATSSVGLRYTFQPDGRYDDTGAAMHVTRVSPSEVVRTTNAYSGNGSYSLEGNAMIFTADDGKRTMNYFRLEQVSNDGGRTWGDELCLFDPASTGEICYGRR